MSKLYPDLDLTQFPGESDNRYIMVDPATDVDLAAISAYTHCIQNSDMVGALGVIENNPQLKQMFFNAEKFNRHEDMIIAIQRFWHSNIQQYLVNLVVSRGIYSPTEQYNKYNVVQYEQYGETQSYMALAGNIPVGSPPTDPAYFILLTMKGDKGASGTGLTWRGRYNPNTQYSLDDCVSYDLRLWVLVNDAPKGTAPSEPSAYWDAAFDALTAVEASAIVEDDFHRLVKIGRGKENQLVVPNHDGDLVASGIDVSDVWHRGNLSAGTEEPSGGQDGDVYFKIVG